MRIQTPRVLLREWRDEDIPLYARILGDPEVRRFFPRVGTRRDAELAIERARERLAEHGFSLMAAERREDGVLMGMIGMVPFNDALQTAIPGHPRVEIGWQLGREFWGHGYAPEAAAAVLELAWTRFALPEIVAITYRGNRPSRRVMEKIGMAYDPAADFEHPELPVAHTLRPHVLYRIRHPSLRAGS